MREITYTIKVYTFEEASPELKEKIKDNFRYKYDLYEHCMSERIDTLEEFAKHIDCRLDYSISCVPDRGEFISVVPFTSYHNTYELLQELLEEKKDCPLTGVCYDEDLREFFKGKKINDETLRECFDSYIKSIHDEYESMFEDEYLNEHCEANGYEFNEKGELV